ncbi:hypothetical protein [Bartonella gliris]|uniref:hypothetical protein n=1 Tax=Bartonella gliris TaxID=3004109 RepID=UPI00295F48AD|nr:hypothetical protein [Bartonella gliris]
MLKSLSSCGCHVTEIKKDHVTFLQTCNKNQMSFGMLYADVCIYLINDIDSWRVQISTLFGP